MQFHNKKRKTGAFVAAAVHFWIVTTVTVLGNPPITTEARAFTSEDDAERQSLLHWVGRLDSDSYATRSRSRQNLLEHALRDARSERRVREVLAVEVKPAEHLERYLAARELLSELDHRAAEWKLDRFMHDATFSANGLPGWDRFSKHTGDTSVARVVFSELVRQGYRLEPLANRTKEGWPRVLQPSSLDREDSLRWIVALWFACERHGDGTGALIRPEVIRLTSILRAHASGPLPRRPHRHEVTQQLVHRYVQAAVSDVRDRLVIGLRYGCESLVREDCHAVLDRPQSTAPHVVTALLVAAAMFPSDPEVDQWLSTYAQDSRVSHIWRSMVPEKVVRRTQVADVVYALQLHRNSIDPRQAGYAAVLADPSLVFQPYSLGFESEAVRQQARESTVTLLHRRVR
ncbi:MAG: hypothetical protein AAFV88_05115 [Planctomycetota bacterium]